jgi:hypothetical protein
MATNILTLVVLEPIFYITNFDIAVLEPIFHVTYFDIAISNLNCDINLEYLQIIFELIISML